MALANILTVSLLVPGMLGARVVDHGPRAGHPDRGPEPSPVIAVWTNRTDDVFARGDRMTVFLRTDVDAFVTLFRVNTDGQVRILFPARPRDDNYVPGGVRFAVPGFRADYTLRVEEYPGEGFLFALVTLDPIAYASFSRAGEWDYAALGLARRVTTDPYVLFSDLLAAFVPETYPHYAYAVTPYHVGERHDYPRFLCYRCHAYVSPVIWNPYAHSCIRVGIPEPVWWQYPTRVYGGTAVVAPPRRLGPGFVVPPRTPADRSVIMPRDRSVPAAGTPPGRRPASVPVTAAPPTGRADPPAAAGRRITTPTTERPGAGASKATPSRRPPVVRASDRRPARAFDGRGKRAKQ